MSDTPTYDQLSALCAQLAEALEEVARRRCRKPDAWGRAWDALTAYRTLSPDPVYAEAKNMLALVETVARSTKDLRVHASVAEILNERAISIMERINRARGEG